MKSVTKNVAAGVKAPEWLRSALDLLKGKCGGKVGVAQGKGKDASNIDAAVVAANGYADALRG